MQLAIVIPEILNSRLLNFSAELYGVFGYFYNLLAYSRENIDSVRQMLDKK
jgi:hypothetical protein